MSDQPTPTGEKLRVGQIGVGNFGAARRTRMRATGLFDLVAAYDINAKALEAARQQDGAQPMESYEALLDVPDLEAVIISTGASFHAPQMIQAMQRGLHVFVEKPMCVNVREVRDILDAQRQHHVVIGVGHSDHAHDAESLTFKRLIDDGTLGDIVSVEAVTGHSGGQLIKPGQWRADPAKNPGGMLFQCGVHKIHELAYYFGPITHVYATLREKLGDFLTTPAAMCHLTFASGLIASLNAYHVIPYRHEMVIHGTKANLYVNRRFFDEGTHCHLQATNLDSQKEARVPLSPDKLDLPNHGELRSFYHAIRTGEANYPNALDGAMPIAVVEAAMTAARTGRLTPVGDFNLSPSHT